MTMYDILSSFASDPLFTASVKLLKHLGVKTSTETEEPIPFLELYEESAKDAGAAVPKPILNLFRRVEKTYFIGAVDDETLAGKQDAVDFKNASARPKYEGMFVFAVKVKDGETLTRGEAAVLTRGINRVVRQQPATVLILEKTAAGEILLSVATCERTAYRQTWRPGEKLGKVSVLKDVNCLSPHRGHVDILESMDVSACRTYDELYAHWKDVFSAKLLTRQFYREIQNWYFWALKKDQHVSFPNALDDETDDGKFNKENLIRLITRLVFTWFMKAKGLVNEDLFKTEFLKKALKHFDPEGAMDDPSAKDADKHCTFYRAILQNLFFATFNQEIKDRGFVGRQVRDAKRYNIKNYYRNAQLFTERDEAKIIACFNGSPFVNGGLFECLDNVEQTDRETGKARVYSWDGFSNSVRFKNGSLKSALIPDRLFFGAERTVDLSEFFENDRSSRAVKVRGIVNILNDYVFTIEENTPLDEDVALDPELLGKVFENLLGCYNPETQQMARNATGSFYTPREIVNYMVRVSLAAYLKRACPKIDAKEIDTLVEGTGELDAMPSVKARASDVLTALFRAKILDPACGSGAFPMGTLAAMVEILRTVDPDNKHWFKVVLEESLKEAESVADVGSKRERDELKAQIEYDFQNRVDFPDYARKLYVIEHCIFGSDIQPIAVQISRLRFFITLLCEQARTDDPDRNYGITPLPNLENNFVAANSLLSIDLKDMRELLGKKKIVLLVKQLRAKRHQLFLPKTSDKKKRLQKEDEELRGQIASAAEGLYDENVRQRIKLIEAEIARADAELRKLTADDFKDVVRDIEETDLFGIKTVTRKTVVGKGKELKKRRDDMAGEIAALKNSSRKERLLADLKRLVAWNPFAFNVAETFLDPEWMFGVKEGFDIVIGNPPYISHDKIPSDTPCEQFKSYEPFADLYCYFYECAVKLLSKVGLVSFITSNSFLRANYGLPLRKYIRENCDVNALIDIEGTQVFDAAIVNTVIAEFSRKGFAAQATIVNDHWDDDSFETFVGRKKFTYKQEDFDSQPWTLVRPECLTIRCKLDASGKTLEKLGTKIRLGLATGDNNAFVLDQQSRDNLVACDPKNIEIIKPIIGGRDIHRYCHSTSHYILLTKNGVDVEKQYPSIYSYLDGFGPKFKSRGAKGKHWTNLRACAFFDDFKLEKIIWIDLTDVGRFSYSANEEYLLNSAYFMIPPSGLSAKCLLGILNSAVIMFYMKQIAATSGMGTLRWINNYVKLFPIPLISDDEQMEMTVIVDRILAAKKQDPDADTSKLEEEIDSIVYRLYGLTDDEIAVVEKAVKK